MPHRLLLSGLAIGPALAAVVLPLPVLGTAVTVAIGGATGIYALVSSFKSTPNPKTRQSQSLLLPAAHRLADLPDIEAQRRSLNAALSHRDKNLHLCPPIDRNGAIASILRRFLASWAARVPEVLAPDELADLWLLDQVLRASPGDAGRLAQLFLAPGAILALRDEVDRLAAKRAIFDRDHAAYLATQAHWEKVLRGDDSGSLLMSIQSLKVPDIDLWHRIVLEHDPGDPQQRAAALWCLRQRGCDRATVAAYLAFLAADGRLQAAARLGDEVYLDTVHDIIERWNAGFYRVTELALSPVDAVAGDAPRMTATLDELARLTGQRRWPDPHGVFTDYPGRPPGLRSNWSLRDGSLTEAPRLRDYVDLPERAIARA